MYRQAVSRLKAGDVIATTLYTEAGTPLLVAGTPLDQRYIRALERRGLVAIYIRDGLADDVAPEDVVSQQVRSTVTTYVEQTFATVMRVATERGAGSQGGVDGAVANLGEQALEIGDDGREAMADLYAGVEQLISEIIESSTVAGLESLKTHNEYTFQHSVDVAVIGTLIGKRLGLPRGRLLELALGCLLHDIGKSYLDVAILDKPGPLTEEEFTEVKKHPLMGYELVRRMPVQSLLPAHVAYQHHEQQRGAGYPRGLVGDNTVAGRTEHERIGSGRLLLIAEIAAVADVYSALSSDRPYRKAVLPDEIMGIVDGMAGRHLNRDVVAAMRTLVPRYPAGRWVEVVQGAHRGSRGVVAQIHPANVDRPLVRLLLGPDGETLSDPREVDTRREPDLELRCLPDMLAPAEFSAGSVGP